MNILKTIISQFYDLPKKTKDKKNKALPCQQKQIIVRHMSTEDGKQE